MPNRTDIAGYDNEGNLRLVVEVKNKTGTTTDWAARMRRNLLIHNVIPNAPFFLIALPDRFYLWKSAPLEGDDRPTYEVDPAPILSQYFSRAGVQPENMSGNGFELLLLSWLTELLQTVDSATIKDEHSKWLIESGLIDALKGGSVAAESDI